MRRTASEVLRNLEVRIARLERHTSSSSRRKSASRPLAERGEILDNFTYEISAPEVEHILETINDLEKSRRVSRNDIQKAMNYLNKAFQTNISSSEGEVIDEMLEMLGDNL